MTKKKLKSLPRFVYIYQERNRDNSTDLLATLDITECGENTVGVYDLRETYDHRYQSQVRRKGTKAWIPVSSDMEYKED